MSYIRRILDHRLGDNVDEEAYDGLCYDVINVRYVEVQGEGAPSNDTAMVLRQRKEGSSFLCQVVILLGQTGSHCSFLLQSKKARNTKN